MQRVHLRRGASRPGRRDAGAQGLAKIDRTKLMARVLGLVAPLIAQPVSKGALSTLYTATAPELAGATSLAHLSVSCDLIASAGLRSVHLRSTRPRRAEHACGRAPSRREHCACACRPPLAADALLACLSCDGVATSPINHTLTPTMLYMAVLTGHGGGYYGPNMLNMGNTSKREPANAYARDPQNWARAYDETLRLLRAKGGLPQ
jgi:hypothetical protein